MTRSNEVGLRIALIKTCLAMSSNGLTFGTSGNASVRLDDDTILITPSAVPYETLQPEDIAALRLDGTYYGRCVPSSEWRFHRDILAGRTSADAVVHTHSPFATALACRNQSIPAFHYMVAVAGGPDIRCAPYATFGTQALSEAVLTALNERSACLMANHGQIALGKDLSSALKLAGEVETLAAMYWRSQQGGTPDLLEPNEMGRVLNKFERYGTGERLDDDLRHAGDHLPNN